MSKGDGRRKEDTKRVNENWDAIKWRSDSDVNDCSDEDTCSVYTKEEEAEDAYKGEEL